MRELVAQIVMLFIASNAFAALPIKPVTTLTAETTNNSSAANTFSTQSNSNLGASNISKLPIRNLLYPGSTTQIYAHLMPWFGPSNHMNVGYDSASASQVKRQVQDIISRGIAGAIVDWYGPLSTHSNTATLNLMSEAELHPGFEFAIMEDVGAVKNAASPQQKLINDLLYINNTYAASPAYMRRGGRPVIFFFGLEAITTIDWNVVRASVLGNPLFIFRNSSAYTKPQTNGGFAWLQTQTTITANYMSLGYLASFYSTALQHPSAATFGSGFKGFDDSLAVWGQNRKIKQFCGQTWLASFAKAGNYYSSSNQLQDLQIVTWNDYEEGSEIESGIDNCFSISASLQGSALTWKITGSETTIDHYTAYVSLDGQNLMPLADLAPGNRSLNLASFDLAAGSYTLYVKAIGKPSILNHVSNGVAYSLDLSIAVTPASLSVQPGQAGQFTVSLTPKSGSFNQPVAFSCSGLPAQSTCSFSPASVTPGAQTARTTLTISTAPLSSANRPAPGSTRTPLYSVGFSTLGLLGAVLMGVGPQKRRRRYAALAALLLGLVVVQMGCGGGGKSTTASLSSTSSASKASTGTFIVVITGTSGSLQLSTTATVIVH